MKKYTWDEIIKDKKDNILIIGYGSLLNKKTHHKMTKVLGCVETIGFKRIYNLPYEKVNYNKATINTKKILTKNELKTIINPICQEGNDGALNCQYTGKTNNIVNGILIKINNEEFEGYKKREYLYDLYETDYYYINPEDGKHIKKGKEKAFILVAKKGPWIKKCIPFESYEKICKLGAYKWGKYFGDTYLKTTSLYK